MAMRKKQNIATITSKKSIGKSSNAEDRMTITVEINLKIFEIKSP